MRSIGRVGKCEGAAESPTLIAARSFPPHEDSSAKAFLSLDHRLCGEFGGVVVAFGSGSGGLASVFQGGGVSALTLGRGGWLA